MVERGEREREGGERKEERKWLEEKAGTPGRWPDLSNITGNIGERNAFISRSRINTLRGVGFILRGYPSISKLYDSRHLETESGINSLESVIHNFLRYHLLTYEYVS